MARWAKGEQTVQFLVDRNRLESFEAEDLATLTEALVARAILRVETTATAALAGGDVDGAYVAAYDAYRMAAEALLARQSQYFDPSAPPLTASDAGWAIEKAREALAGVKTLLAASPPERFG
jgi:hypothetical protein